MYPSPFRYHRPTSLSEAIDLLKSFGEDGRVLAGGQSLIPMMKLRLANPTDLVDLGGIAELSEFSIVDSSSIVAARTIKRS